MKALLQLMMLWLGWLVNSAVGQEYSDAVKQWPRKTLRFTESMPMKDIFDSGFEPYRMPGRLGHLLIGLRHVMLRIETRRGVLTPALPMERAEFRVRQPGSLISTSEFFTPPLTISEARVEMTKWLPLGQSTAVKMEAYLAAAKADWLHYAQGPNSVGFGVYWGEKDGMNYTIYFMQAFDWDAPVRMHLVIDSNNLKPRRILDTSPTPLQPPAGYEHLSMETPQESGPDNIAVPVTNEPRSPRGSLPPGVKLPETLPAWGGPSSTIKEKLKPEGTAVGNNSVNPISWMVGLLALLAGLIFVRRTLAR